LGSVNSNSVGNIVGEWGVGKMREMREKLTPSPSEEGKGRKTMDG
jgi:hypothetical protein